MVFDYSKLRGRIVEKYGSQAAFADAIDMSISTLNLKLNNKSEWSTTEIVEACKLLDVELTDTYSSFFKETL